MNRPESQTPFISPQRIPREIYPYGRVWRSLLQIIGAMLGMVLLVWGGVRLGILRDVPSDNWGLLLILVPLGVYLWVAVRGEQLVKKPREGLITVLLFSALLANGVGLPLMDNVFQPRQWLYDGGFFTRVLGYTCTFGVTTEFLKYIAIRYTVWPSRIRMRMDGIAYSMAAAVGYSVVLNAQVVFEAQPTVTADALRIAANFIAQVSFGTIMGFFLAETALHDRPPFFLGLGLFIGAFMQGVYIGFRALAAGSGFSVSNINGLLVLLLFAVLTLLTLNFLINTANARDEALGKPREGV